MAKQAHHRRPRYNPDYLTNNVLRRELERIARAAARTDDDPKRLVTQNRQSGNLAGTESPNEHANQIRRSEIVRANNNMPGCHATRPRHRLPDHKASTRPVTP